MTQNGRHEQVYPEDDQATYVDQTGFSVVRRAGGIEFVQTIERLRQVVPPHSGLEVRSYNMGSRRPALQVLGGRETTRPHVLTAEVVATVIEEVPSLSQPLDIVFDRLNTPAAGVGKSTTSRRGPGPLAERYYMVLPEAVQSEALYAERRAIIDVLGSFAIQPRSFYWRDRQPDVTIAYANVWTTPDNLTLMEAAVRGELPISATLEPAVLTGMADMSRRADRIS